MGLEGVTHLEMEATCTVYMSSEVLDFHVIIIHSTLNSVSLCLSVDACLLEGHSNNYTEMLNYWTPSKGTVYHD